MDEAMRIDASAVAVRDELLDRLRGRPAKPTMLTLLSVGFACPQAVSKFAELLPAIHGCTYFWLPFAPTSTVSLMTSIDQIESDARANTILRRICLAQLRRRYYTSVSQHGNTPGRPGKASSNTIEEMTNEWMMHLRSSARNGTAVEKDECSSGVATLFEHCLYRVRLAGFDMAY